MISKIVLAFVSSIFLAVAGAYCFVSLDNKETANFLFSACLVNFTLALVLLFLMQKKKAVN